MRTEYIPKTHIDGVAVSELVKEYGSPLFVISEKTIRELINRPKELLPHVTRRCSLPGHIKPIT
jgi:diaminopimelate decarboxylase